VRGSPCLCVHAVGGEAGDVTRPRRRPTGAYSVVSRPCAVGQDLGKGMVSTQASQQHSAFAETASKVINEKVLLNMADYG